MSDAMKKKLLSFGKGILVSMAGAGLAYGVDFLTPILQSSYDPLYVALFSNVANVLRLLIKKL